jgi:hypothetical protein
MFKKTKQLVVFFMSIHQSLEKDDRPILLNLLTSDRFAYRFEFNAERREIAAAMTPGRSKLRARRYVDRSLAKWGVGDLGGRYRHHMFPVRDGS